MRRRFAFQSSTAWWTSSWNTPPTALGLLPGHAYFLAQDESELRERFRHELLPLLDEYLRGGFLGACAAELHAVRDAIEDLVQHGRPAR